MSLPASIAFVVVFIILVALIEEYRDRRNERRIARWREAAEAERAAEQREREAFGRYQAARDGAVAARMLREAGITGGEVDG